MKPRVLTCIALLLVGWFTAGRAAADADTTLWLQAPAGAAIEWRGLLPTEGAAVGMGQQIGPYIVPGPVGLLVAVFAHGAIMQGVQSAQQRQEQEAADHVLAPYTALLQAWPATTLWEAAAASTTPDQSIRLVGEDNGAALVGTRLEALPVFMMAQDESALLLDVTVKLTPGDGSAPVQARVRVVSSQVQSADMRSHWLADDARQLKATASAMLGHALQLARRHAAPAADDSPTRTHRYLQGTVERAERAQMLNEDCKRTVLRTLRGAVLSVPVRAKDDCVPATGF